MTQFGFNSGMSTSLDNNDKLRSKRKTMFSKNHDLKTNLKVKDKGKVLSEWERRAIRNKIRIQQRKDFFKAATIVLFVCGIIAYLIHLIR